MHADVRTILAGELHQLADDLISKAPGLSEGSEDAAVHCLGLCERLGQVANMIEAPALQEVAVFLMTNIPALLGTESATRAPAELCASLELCLLEGEGSAHWQQLAANMADSRWPAALDSTSALEITQNLKPLANAAIETDSSVTPQCSRADLTLTPPGDVGEATLGAFFHEAPQQAAKLSRLLNDYRATHDAELLRAAQRVTHTLKGSSALCGLGGIAHLCHALEARLSMTNDASAAANFDLLLAASDAIEQLVELVTQNAPASDRILDSALELIHALCAPESVTTSTVEPPSIADTARAESAPAEASQSSVEPERMLHVPVALIDENLRQAGELNIGVGQLNAHVARTIERVRQLTQQLERVQSQVYELETLVDTRGVPANRVALIGGGKLDRGDFDPLELDEYTALHSLSRAFGETTLDSRELTRELGDDLLHLQNALSQHARLGRDLSDSITHARLIPVETIAPRLERIVRQTARMLDREVRLRIDGRDLRIDTDILHGLVEPLLHALRNAIDHGLESPSERIAAGKSADGDIEIAFRREGNRIEVRVSDDGRGLDYAAIERRARELNLLPPNRVADERELCAFIFHPGFSTRREASAISGRGVGMDAVRASVERMKGRVHVESRVGRGCTLTFVLPLSLTSAHALFVRVGDVVYGLPSTSVEQVLYSDAGSVRQLGARHVFEYNGQVAPLYWLGSLVGGGVEPQDLATQPRPLVIVRDDAGLAAVAVDRALDSRQIVIKGLSRYLPALPGVAGACVLPDGGVGVVLELRELLRRTPTTMSAALTQSVVASANARRALIVDDSLSARRTLAQLLGDSGYAVDTATDGLDALAAMERAAPDLLIVDLEMPRMNGLELTAHLRSKNEWHELPIVMITSRAAEKHRAQALRAGVTEYHTKPYIEHELLDRLFALAPP